MPEIQDSEIIEQNIEKFITHFVWHKEDYQKKSMWGRLENWLNEMLSRRKKLLKNMIKKDVEKSG